jgi:hypothetical protein
VYQGAFDRTEHYIGDGLAWTPVLHQLDDDGTAVTKQGDVSSYRPGHTYVERWNHAPFGPAFSDIPGAPQAVRSGDQLTMGPTLFSEVSRPSRVGVSLGALRQSLFRDGVLVHEQIDDGLSLFLPIDVPAARASYRFEANATRSGDISELSSHVSAAWTFSSAHTQDPQVLPLPTLRFAPSLDDNNSAVRWLPLVLPVEIERPRGAATPPIRKLAVEASFDDGATWRPVHGALSGTRFVGIVIHSAKGAFVSLRGTASDANGNRVEQTIIRAYKLR